MVEVMFELSHLVDKNNLEDKKFYVEHRDELLGMRFVSHDLDVLVELERRGLGWLSPRGKFYPGKQFPRALKKMLQQKVATAELNADIDVTDIMKIWLTSFDIAMNSLNETKNKSSILSSPP